MPSSMTHAYFSKDVYNKLDDKIKAKLSVKHLKIFSQGPDIYYFYNFLLGKKAKKVFNIGTLVHEKNVNEYFYNMISYIIKNRLIKDKEVLSYLYGSICHYVLDSTMHPFIIYKTGIFDKSNKNTYKYNGKHQEYEYYFDIYMIFQNEKRKGYKYKVYKKLFKVKKINNNLTNLINDTMKKTYNINNSSKYYKKSLKHMKKFFRIANYDRFGIKKKIYIFLDKILPKSKIKFEELSYHINYYDKLEYLNLDKNYWYHPCNKEEKYNYSFIDLYFISINKAIKIINEVNILLKKKKITRKEIDFIFNNLSYTTGKNCNENIKLKYFEY